MVTDSAASLPVEVVNASGVTVVPMWVAIGGQQYRDGELSLEEVLSRSGEGLSTSGPAPGELADAARRADQGEGVVILTLAHEMSAVYQSARLATGLLEGETPNGKKVAVVDTGTAAGAEGLVVLAASRAAHDGLPLDAVVERAQRAARRVRLLATLPSLDYLARGGRVPGAAAWGARWLGLNPVFEFRKGKVKPLRPARGSRLARQRIIDIWAREIPAERARGAALHVAAMHAVEPAVADELMTEVRRRFQPATAFVGSFSPVMVAHTGPGLVGLAWWWDDPGA
ncbi:MAG TPA: DegV family protein [Acidimicrobiales bacterium]|nr:DegV family protein [Acidimicrobiales bacterium]